MDPNDQDEYVKNSFSRFMTKKRRKGRLKPGAKFILRISKSRALQETIHFYSRFQIQDLESHTEGNDKIHEIEDDGGYSIYCPPGTDQIYRPLRDEPPPVIWQQLPSQIRSQLDSAGVNKVTKEGITHYSFTRIGSTYKDTFYIGENGALSDLPQRYDEIKQYIRDKPLSPEGLLRFMAASPFFHLVQILATGADLYSEFPGATITPEILGTQALGTLWYDEYTGSDYQLSIIHSGIHGRRGSFRLMVFLETGYDLGDRYTSELTDAIAVSMGNTLYIDPRILGHPIPEITASYNIRRIRGNIGRPGVNLIGWFSEQIMECRRADPARWQLVNHYSFDGKLEDYFGSTSLHLRFTGYTKEMQLGDHKRISNGAFVDATVSAFDSGEWLGDLNILDSCVSPDLEIVAPIDGCTGEALDNLPEEQLITIENWEEFLSPHPSMPGVVKCHGNWQARLTAVAMCIQHGFRPILFRNHGCWSCALKLLHEDDEDGTSSSGSTASETESCSSSSVYSGDESEDEIQTAASENDLPEASSRRHPRPSTETTDSKWIAVFII